MFNFLMKYGAVLLAFILFGCRTKNEENGMVIARVAEKKLYISELNEVIPSDMQEEDSVAMASDYINKWIKRQLMIQKAEENLTMDQKDLSKELEEYRNSLIIYRYKNELLKQRMDTSVTEQQIREFYEENTDNFNLNRNIVKAIFIKIPQEFANPELLKTMSRNASEEGINELRDYCLQYAKSFDIFTENWVDFELVTENVPRTIDEPEVFLKQNDQIELTDSDYYYLVSILDYKLKNTQSPLEFAKENIKNLIINRRKINFLKEVENNVYTEGIRKNKVRINKKITDEAK